MILVPQFLVTPVHLPSAANYLSRTETRLSHSLVHNPSEVSPCLWDKASDSGWYLWGLSWSGSSLAFRFHYCQFFGLMPVFTLSAHPAKHFYPKAIIRVQNIPLYLLLLSSKVLFIFPFLAKMSFSPDSLFWFKSVFSHPIFFPHQHLNTCCSYAGMLITTITTATSINWLCQAVLGTIVVSLNHPPTLWEDITVLTLQMKRQPQEEVK